MVVAAAAALLVAPPAQAAPQVRYLGFTTVPHKLRFQDTTVGGLSGIDRDPRTGEYVLISDDRGYTEAPRLYTATLDVTAQGPKNVQVTSVHQLKRPNGQVYPSPAADPANAIDPEEIRVDPLTGKYWWTQEGDRTATALVQPSVQSSTRTGGYDRNFPLPKNYAIEADRGPRRNQALESLAFSAGGALVTTVVEGPLLQDGDQPTTAHGARNRLTVQDRFGHVLTQHVYELEKLFATPEPGPYGPDTGVPALLADQYVPGRYYALERTWIPGPDYKVRLFQVDTLGATNLGTNPTDAIPANARPVRKTLLADLADFPLPTDNVEGLTWGPRLPTGERTLVLVSDDNFSPDWSTQFIALALR
ncbi:esterase-like activity of phytase family protein [Actinosynnema sp. NPDC020468]|uniref:esterase-like activity of phytase family protein n=1 Tax=Actinosynnema sp. NPDC020468 TaxID=3154488 RepID=UPI0033E7FDA6